MITNLDRKLLQMAGELLDSAADEFSNHGCNDWHWPDYMSPGDRLAVARMMEAFNRRKAESALTDNEATEAVHMANTGPPDWWIMRFLASRLQALGE